MGRQKENNLVASIFLWLKSLGPECKTVKLHGSIYQERGTPDLLVIYRGAPFLLEVKLPGKRPTEIQKHRLEQWRRAGATVAVVRSVSEARRIVLRLEEAPQ